MARHTIQNTETGDYIQLRDCSFGEITEWFRITYKHAHECDGFICIDTFGTEHDHNQYSDITDLKLPSEMDYAF